MPDDLPQTHFICYRCAVVPDDPREPPQGHLVFKAAPTGVDHAGGVPTVPTAECPHCGRVCRELPIERNRRLAQADGRLSARSEEGRERLAKAAAIHHWKHGRYSQAALGPACRSEQDEKRCQGCEYYESEDPDTSLCIPAGKCLRDENRWLRVLHAFDTGNPARLKDVYGEANAHAVALLMRMVEAVERGELTIKQPVPGCEDGVRTEINPIITELVKLMKVLGVDPASWRMTTQSAGVGAKDDAEASAAKVQGSRDALDFLRDPNAPVDLKETLAEAIRIIAEKLEREKGKSGAIG